MKILIRRFDNEYYVWKDAKYKDNNYYINDSGVEIPVSEIVVLAVKDDNRDNKVICKHCGELIDDNPDAIEKHFASREASRNCLICDKCVPYGTKKNLTTVYTSNGDGTYHQCINSDVRLCCKNAGYYSEIDINSSDAAKYCQFNQCRTKGVRKFEDFFLKYPGAFDKQLTVDFLNEKGFAFETYYNGYFWYDLKLRGALQACVNEMGVIDHFVVKHRGWTYNAYYSERYDTLFFEDYNLYSETTPSNMSDSKHKSAKDKIAALYKEANKK
jgi:hypothetical protein